MEETVFKRVVLVGSSNSGKKIFMRRLIDKWGLYDILAENLKITGTKIYNVLVNVFDCSCQSDYVSALGGADGILYFCGDKSQINWEKFKIQRS